MTKVILTAAFFAMFCLPMLVSAGSASDGPRRRARDLGVVIGAMRPGPLNAITDVSGVLVGHRTLKQGKNVRTGVTVVVPHAGNLFQEKVPAGLHITNGFGKFAGVSQIRELGNIETPVALTNTLSIGAAMEGLIQYTLAQPGNAELQSINAVAGEINDGYLSDIQGLHVRPRHILEAIAAAKSGPVEEGSVGAGHGGRTMGFKSGIGTASRVLPKRQGGYTVGVLAVTNFGGHLVVDGVPVGRLLAKEKKREEEKGSCVFVIATDAPVDARNLERMAERTALSLGRVGSYASNGSGDYALAFSTHPKMRIKHGSKMTGAPVVSNAAISPLFEAVIEAGEEAIVNSLFMAERVVGRDGHTIDPLPVDRVMELMKTR